jgi:predicted amidohydrolase YtcJ
MEGTMKRTILGAAGGVLALAFAANAAIAAGSDAVPPADLVLVHGHIITVDAADSIAQAVAVRGGKIIAVGSDQQILALAGKNTQKIDLHGRTATPGLIDSHAHVAADGYEEITGVGLSKISSVTDATEIVKARVAQLKPGEWVHGSGWDEGKLREKRYITAADLDAVSPDNPVWLMHTSGHYGVANSVALRLANITPATENPKAGTIDRNAQGVPTGVLKELAMSLIEDLIPSPTPEQRRKGILNVIETLHREGMTAFKDPEIEQPTWDAYHELLDLGQLSEHVCVLWAAGTTLESAKAALKEIQGHLRPPKSLGEGTLLSCGAKIFMDGSGGARTAWVYKEWNKNSTEVDPGNLGYPRVDPDVYRQQVRLFHQAGVNVGTHAIGDHAIDWVVDTYALVEKEKPTQGLRHSIIHANIPTDHALDVMADLQKRYDAGYPETQPEFTWWIGDLYAGNFGVERSQRLLPLKTFQSRGIQWAGGSDFGVTPLPARLGIWSAIERETLQGSYGFHPFGTAESVDVHAALRAYTGVAARQLFLERQVGSIEIGKDADIAVWNKDWYSIPSQELKDIQCVMTLFRGKIVFRAQP